MSSYKALFVIDRVEFRYFEFNTLVTSFWLIKECLERNWEVHITTIDRLSLNNSKPEALMHEVSLINPETNPDIKYDKTPVNRDLNGFDTIFFRPDPPVDMDYIFATQIVDYVDKSKTLLLNSPTGIRKANEKLYINNFPEYVPTNIVTSDNSKIRDFLSEYGEIVVKPLNKCFGKGVFYLKQGDKNINSILDTVTNGGTTAVMAQQFIKSSEAGDKRIIIINGEVFDETIIKVSGKGDFKFNSHKDEYLQKGYITEEERAMCIDIASKLIEDGLYMVGLDVIEGKIIEINLTSPCFFIKEINKMHNVMLEKRIINIIEDILLSKEADTLLSGIN